MRSLLHCERFEYLEIVKPCIHAVNYYYYNIFINKTGLRLLLHMESMSATVSLKHMLWSKVGLQLYCSLLQEPLIMGISAL